MEFKPLVQVDPSVLSSNRTPLQNPRIGDYNLKQTASTEGIASKKSLELKKRYLLGETATSGIMKSDSTSVLDSKFKNFRSTISDCQKLLNPASEISPAMKHFLKNTNISDNKSSSQTENTTSRESVKEVKEELHKNGEEKENVYDRIVSTKNELNKSDIELSKPARISDYAETINIVLVENKIKELSAKPIDTIDLTTPEKADASEPTIDVTKIELSQKVIATNQAFINSLDTSPIKNNVVIDLTGDSPQKDISITVKVENPDPNPKYQEDEKSPKTKAGMSPERTKHAIDSMLQKRGSEQSRSPIHETSITVPKIPWVPKNNEDDDVESDSLSSNSSSSVDDIPHYILDSTTSPDTQPGDRFVPRLEIRDTSGELMQIDSLMIIDGKYVGDPEDLKHMKMPERMAPPKPEAPPVPPKAATNVSVTNIEPVGTKKTEQIRAAGISTPKIEVNNSAKAESTSSTESPEKRKPTIYRYESFNRRPDLKFDTKNENKIDTLKNLPLILPKELENVAKPTDLPIGEAKKASDASDNDKTPTVAHPCIAKAADPVASDSETEITGQALTETELSDWTADDAVSENFVDIEFALNSNKGTIKRNKKSKRKHSSSSSVQKKQNGPKTECPIVKDLDFDNIEFMDTGSEDSCVETYSATNKAMLKNRGYVQFVNTTNPQNKDVYKYKNTFGSMVEKPQKPSSIDISDNTTRNVEIPGVDYIEQGACILSNEIDLKTPMNEMPPIFAPVKQLEQHDSLNDVEDDSLVMVASHGGHTTTEESDALTVVTSPMESMPRNIGSSSVNTSFDKTGSSSTNKSSPSKKSLSKDAMTPTNESPIKRKSSQEDILNISGRKESDDMSYEEYVRQLQLKITQISNARDSIDVRKTKRKHSRADGSFDGPMPPTTVIDNNKPLSIYVNKTLPEAPVTETARIEELTKERTKQKDLIHDLVMNKLQSKKQLNAEKRLNRSRNRSSILSPPNNATATGPPSTSSSAISLPHNPSSCSIGQRSMQSGGDLFNSLKMLESERRASLYNSTKALSSKPNEPYFATPAKHLQASAAKERPRSDNIEAYPVFETPKLNKTQSFCVYANRNAAPARMRFNASPMQAQFADNVSGFSTPMATNRRTNDESVTQTEKLRQEARARARAKSNQDLGLSPEEKIALLRKRYHLDMSNASQASSMAPSTTGSSSGADLGGVINKSDDMKVRERKMMASKSVNDIAASHRTGDSGSRPKSAQKLTDSSSDPNLLDGKTPSKRRHKDPERRKSIIQTVSDFFHKKKEKEPSSPKEKSEGMFGRFRISPKSKSKVWMWCCSKIDAPS